MATAAEPRPAQLPLPGGREGATVRLHPLLCAQMIGPPAFMHRTEGRLAPLRAIGVRVREDDWMEIPVQAFLVEHPGAGLLLIDTGFHASVAVDPRQGMGRLGGLIFKQIQMDQRQAVPAQLRERGLDADDVSAVLMTHLHSDHASGIAQFPEATFVLSAQEWQSAAEGSQTEGYIRRQFDHAFDYRTVDFESADADSFATFGRALDLFGDGSVRMLFTPGHTAGHCSYLLQLSDGQVLLTGDAAYTRRTIDDTALPYRMADEHRFRRSLREIQLFLQGAPDTLAITGHDMPAWRRLQSVYE